MDDFYSSLPLIPDPKHGLGLLSTDLETLQFPTLCTDFDQEQLLALDDPNSFYLAFPDAGVFGTRDEALSRASSALTPLSECSTRTAFSTRNISPTSEILSFPDNPTPKDIEAMFHDTTQSIVSGRQSRATSASWPSTNGNSTGLNVTLTPPARPIPHRPQSFSYKTPQITHQAGKTPPPPSSFFPSPNLQPQAARSPFLTPTATSPIPPQMPQISTQTGFVQGSMAHNPSSYFAQLQSQPPPSQQQLTQIAQQQQQQFQQQMQLQQQQQILALRQSVPQQQQQQQALPVQFQNQVLGMNHISALFPGPAQPPLNSLNPTATTTQQTQQPTLPNTIGNSSTGYQCFSHGCGGRHFSNWGNLVRHHRERQLRSKAGAKPACPRCGKGFTRSSARDAHVAGLKCVLGRRRRGTTATVAAGGVKAADSESEAVSQGTGTSTSRSRSKDDGDDENENENDASSDGSREDDNYNDNDNDGADANVDGSESKDDEGDEVHIMGAYTMHDDDDGFDLNLDLSSGGHTYLAPQQLQFDH